jgi:hypothetical protein
MEPTGRFAPICGSGGGHGSEQADRRQRPQRRGEEAHPGEEKVQGRAQGALMGKLFLVAIAIGVASLIGLAVFVIQL